jgi:hypothetical protein
MALVRTLISGISILRCLLACEALFASVNSGSVPDAERLAIRDLRAL